MTVKRPNLAALAEAAGSLRSPVNQVPPPTNARRTTSMVSKQATVAPSRIGQKPITAFFPAAVRVQLKMMAAEQSRSMESMLAEALNDLFAKHGKPEIAPVT